MLATSTTFCSTLYLCGWNKIVSEYSTKLVILFALLWYLLLAYMTEDRFLLTEEKFKDFVRRESEKVGGQTFGSWWKSRKVSADCNLDFHFQITAGKFFTLVLTSLVVLAVKWDLKTSFGMSRPPSASIHLKC